ncbi:DNA-binding protein HU [Geodia barretti]|uniref:DNA-binding protein HU n=1 Tax=Geodia barretti TaxID=519541 RepID=A0AA35RR83_GEOBA|nr:DNA-binding protein HU [Geodia barretti]
MSDRVADKLGCTKAQGEAALNAVLRSVQDELSKGNRVVLTGFGTFELRDVKARKVRPIRGSKAGDLIEVPAHKRVGFSAGAELSKAAQS